MTGPAPQYFTGVDPPPDEEAPEEEPDDDVPEDELDSDFVEGPESDFAEERESVR